MTMTDLALIIDEPWISEILAVRKIWEMRSRPTQIRGRIRLIRKGSGLIVGEARLYDSKPKLSPDEFARNYLKHRIPFDMSIYEKWPYPWAMDHAVAYDEPIPYNHPQGAVVWVKIDF